MKISKCCLFIHEIKIIRYKYCRELSLLLQGTTYTFESVQSPLDISLFLPADLNFRLGIHSKVQLPINDFQRIYNMQFTGLSEQELIWSIDDSMIITCIQWFNFWELNVYLITRPILGNSIWWCLSKQIITRSFDVPIYSLINMRQLQILFN